MQDLGLCLRDLDMSYFSSGDLSLLHVHHLQIAEQPDFHARLLSAMQRLH